MTISRSEKENVQMVRSRIGLVLVAIVLPMAFLCSSCGSPGSASAATTFSKSSIKGSYAMSFAVAVGGGAAIDYAGGTGVIVSDGNGSLSGSESFSDTDGTVCTDATISGTYTVNPNGTGTINISLTSTEPGCTESFTESLAIANGGSLVKTTNLNTNVAQLSGDWTRQ
jgi:hypothetical protein